MKKSINETISNLAPELIPLKNVLIRLRTEGKILLAILYGSYAAGTPHKRSDIDLAIFMRPASRETEIDVIGAIHSSVDREVSILRLDDEDESPFIVQAALKGIHLAEPDGETLYRVADRALHESEDIRFRRAAHA